MKPLGLVLLTTLSLGNLHAQIEYLDPTIQTIWTYSSTSGSCSSYPLSLKFDFEPINRDATQIQDVDIAFGETVRIVDGYIHLTRQSRHMRNVSAP